MAERGTMMDQYRRIKARHRDAILFFRLGDFYEMFFEDAVEASSLLDLTLTQRQGEPMCGIPYHAAKGYLARLLRLGKKIAVCEQLTEPGEGKGIVERDVVEVVTPGTTLEEDFLEQGANNYLVSTCVVEGSFCLSYLDLSTGEFRAYSRPDPGSAGCAELLRSELYRLAPRELLVQQSLLEREPVAQAISEVEGLVVNRFPDWSFSPGTAAAELLARFGLASLKGLGFGPSGEGRGSEPPELAAAGILLRYVDETAKAAAPHLAPPLPYRDDEFVSIDEGSRKNLELVRNLGDAGKGYSLLAILDETKTAPGARLLRQWILQPLRGREAVEERLDAVEFLYRDQRLLSALRESLAGVRDIERLASRVAMDKAHAKDLLAIALSIRACLGARIVLDEAAADRHEALPTALLDAIAPDLIREAEACAGLVEASIKDEPSVLLGEGGLVKRGYDAELDRLHAVQEDSRAVLERYLEEERADSGISNLRVRFNKIIGYYLEVSKGKLESVPRHFIRRQSLVTGERFTTARLSELESEINGATERIVELERRLFLEVRQRVKDRVPALLALGRAAAQQDCLASFARVATVRGYSRPRVVERPALRIVEGRHPVVEAHLPAGTFVPNGISLDASASRDAEAAHRSSAASALSSGAGTGDSKEPLDPGESTPHPRSAESAIADSAAESASYSRFAESAKADSAAESASADSAAPFALITGPNMAGKSTFLRQTALIALMAQAGSFVPALDAEIGLVDKIFCRVGAQDNLARGESTFLVEMHETAFILNTATPRSLVIMDEVGRGTSTIDGLAIAWAVCERILDSLGCRALFATHYHELTAIAHPRLRNFSLAVAEEEGEVVFLKRIEPGPARGSYGIHVAKLAGLPETVLTRARDIRDDLARKEKSLSAGESLGAKPVRAPRPAPSQGGLFPPSELVLAELASIDTDRLTPLEALNRLAALKSRLQA